MTPEQKIKHTILSIYSEQSGEVLPEITNENIDEVYEEWYNDDYKLGDVIYEFREGEFETGLGCERSRHYESKAVAAKMVDGGYVGWTYWYGGGKHGQPDCIDWMEDAYDVSVKEATKVVLVFKRD